METDPSLTIAVEDVKDNQENHYTGSNLTSSRERGYRKTYNNYNNYRYHNRQGQGGNYNAHYYNNGYNSYNNGYNNGYNNHNNYGGGRNYSHKRHFHNDHYTAQQNNYPHSPHHYNNYNRSYYHQPYYNSETGIAPASNGTTHYISPGSQTPTHAHYIRPNSAISSSASDKSIDSLSSSSSEESQGQMAIAALSLSSSDDETKESFSPSVPSLAITPPTITPLFPPVEIVEGENGFGTIRPLIPAVSESSVRQSEPGGTYFNQNQKSYYSYPPGGQGHHNHHSCHDEGGNRGGNHSYHNYHTPNNRYLRREGHFDFFSTQNQFQLPNFYHTSNHDSPHLHGTGHMNSVFTPELHQYIFPEISIPLGADPNKSLMNLADQNCSLDSWVYEDEEGGCLRMAHCENLGTVSIQQAGQGNQGTYTNHKKRGGNHMTGQYDRVSSGGQAGIRRPNYYGRSCYSENRSWNQAINIDELADKYHVVGESERPHELAPPGHELEKLSEQVWIKFQNNQQTLETYRRKLELWRELAETVRRYNHSYHLEMVGSTISGFGSNTSDIDMCLILDHRHSQDPRSEAIDILEAVCPLFELLPHLEKTELIMAKVPILKLNEKSRGIDIDINVNNAVGLRNTHLLQAYSLLDWRVRPLVLVVKLWAHTQGINDAKQMTLSSYSLALMVIHYLQAGASPTILPSLQVEFREKFAPGADFWKNKKQIRDPAYFEWKAENVNSQCLGELLVGFLEYYASTFEYRSNAISVRVGATIPVKNCMLNRSAKNDAYQWKHICIEEPFEFTNTARSVYDKDVFDRIRGVFYASWQRLVISRDLESIFQTISPIEARAIGARAKQL